MLSKVCCPFEAHRNECNVSTQLKALRPIAPAAAPVSLKSARTASASARRALIAQQTMAQAPNGLQAALVAEHFSLAQALKIRQSLTAAPENLSLSQILSLLPPKIAAKIIQSRNEALLKMLLAWGRSLRKDAALAKKAQQRHNYQAQVLKGHQQSDGLRRAEQLSRDRASRSAQGRARGVQLAFGLDTEHAAASMTARTASQGLLGSGFNRPVLEALPLPLASGFSLRSATMRLRTEAGV